MEDKDRGDFLFLDLPSLPLSKQSRPTDPLIETLPKLPDQPELVPENPKSAPENVRFDKVFSRKKTVVPESIQVQDFNPNSENEVTISNPSLQSESHVNNDDQDFPIVVRKGIRECTNRPLYPLTHFLSFKKISPSHRALLVSLKTISIPTTVSEALTNEKWKQAMNVEMEALEKNKTWELVKLPVGNKPVGCKWVYTVKYKADGSIERYKARLVAKGYTQTYGIDYQETFASVAKMNTVRVLLSLAANYNWDLQQFDVKNAFLHGELEKEIYMELARQSQGDHTLFIKHSSSGGLTTLLVYVDDIIVTGNDDKERQVLNQCLAKEFEIKALGRLKYFLGIEVAHSKQGIFISQEKYVTNLLKETGKTACKPASIPIDPNIRLGEAEKDATVDKEMYQCLVGRLIYLSHTRPNIAYAVSVINQFMHSPKEAHPRAAYQVLQYLKGTSEDQPLDNAPFLVEISCYGGIVLEDLKIKWDGPMRLYCDNKSAINITHNPVQHDRTKHIEIDRHFIKEKLDSGLICTPYVSTHGQLADILTKGLSSSMFQSFVSKLGMVNTHSPA
ncbi:Retrovirus-related Pol polyprotein from transposon RE2 [Vitis vinifera]|nr:Retrovirus-related Pol polyprotein from transposon RE2 [Vitis vinifera]